MAELPELEPGDDMALEEGFQTLLDLQQELQAASMKDGDPAKLVGDVQSGFMIWNAWALVEEMKEAMDEVAWKPWAHDKPPLHRVNTERFAKEMVDLLHFFANLCLAAGVDGHDLAQGYISKRKRNAERQKEGYDAVTGKCPLCKRSFDDVGSIDNDPDHGRICIPCYQRLTK